MTNSLNLNDFDKWQSILGEEFQKPYFFKLQKQYQSAVISAKERNKLVFPRQDSIFKAFSLTSPQSLKVVLLGQDPYPSFYRFNGKIIPHAMGLAFSVPRESSNLPASLKNIFKELQNDMQIPPASHGDLSKWAEQGVLLMNCSFSVEQNAPNSHAKIWQNFSDSIIAAIAAHCEKIIFLLWGNFAKNKAEIILKNSPPNRHFILKAAHPSPLARGAFFGSCPFSHTNEILKKIGKSSIDWELE